MSIRFSAARGETNPAIARVLCPVAVLDAANDNPRLPTLRAALAARRQAVLTPGSRTPDTVDIPGWTRAAPAPAGGAFPDFVPDALRHFARHGLSAALQARIKAEAALEAGDEVECARWLGICRQFDRRMADAAARHLAGRR